MKEIAKILMLSGSILLISGVVIYVIGDKLKWFGSLPGDIRIDRPGFSFYMPFTSMLLVSVLLSLVIWLARKMF